MSGKEFLITEDGSHTIYIPEINETYHSRHGAIQESEYVFIQQGLDFRAQSGHQLVKIFELGFGTGLNAFLSLMFAEKHQVSVQYQTIEAYPLDMKDISRLNYVEVISDDLLGDYFLQLHQAEWNSWVEITNLFRLKKIKGKIQALDIEDKFDVCYFDAFAPSKQPEIWCIPILEKVGDLLVEGGVFVTYCAKGQLKRDLRSLGFSVESLPGPPGKKEMIRAVKAEFD